MIWGGLSARGKTRSVFEDVNNVYFYSLFRNSHFPRRTAIVIPHTSLSKRSSASLLPGLDFPWFMNVLSHAVFVAFVSCPRMSATTAAVTSLVVA